MNSQREAAVGQVEADREEEGPGGALPLLSEQTEQNRNQRGHDNSDAIQSVVRAVFNADVQRLGVVCAVIFCRLVEGLTVRSYQRIRQSVVFLTPTD